MTKANDSLPDLTNEEILRYSRHLILPGVGMRGQQRLKAASVLLVGAGGLGSPVALYLAAAGVGHIGLVDFDTVACSNLQRQVIHDTTMLDKPKVESARKRMLALNPAIQVDVYREAFAAENAARIAEPYRFIVDGTDNFPARYLINDLCVLTGKTYIFGSIYRFDGQASVFDASRGPCYRCVFPDPPPPDAVPSCAEGGVLGVLPGTIGTIQATETLKLILGIGTPLIGKLLVYDALDMAFEYIKIRKNPACRICGEHPEITGLNDLQAYCQPHENEKPDEDALDAAWIITPKELAARLKSGEKIRLIDVRQPDELAISRFAGAESIPLENLAERLDDLKRDEKIVLICRMGKRSAQALRIMQDAGFHRAQHLAGGINAWAAEIDPSLPVY